MQTGDLFLVRGCDFVGRAIENITHSPYCHVAIVVDNRLVEASGFHRTNYQSFQMYPDADIFVCPGLTFEQRSIIAKFMEEQIGTHYSYSLIIFELVRYCLGIILPLNEQHEYICSTLVSRAYRAVGIELCPNVLFPSPGDIATSSRLRKIERGVV